MLRALLFCFFFVILLAAVLHLSRTNSTSHAHAELTLTLVIPATFEDYRCYVQHFYERVKEGYILPDELLLVVSGVPVGYHESALDLDEDLKAIVEVVFESRPHNQAMNKNTGAAMATGDMILFFDIDDSLHPWGLYAVKEAYRVNSQAADLSGIMFSHGHYQKKEKTMISRKKKVPTCTISSTEDFCHRLARFKRKHDITGVFQPYCRTVQQPCHSQPLYSSSKLYEACFAEHVDAYTNMKANWCCLTDGRPNFAAGWLLVRRSDFLRFQRTYDVAEDGQLIGHYLSLGKKIHYVDIPIAYYNQDHHDPPCSNSWF